MARVTVGLAMCSFVALVASPATGAFLEGSQIYARLVHEDTFGSGQYGDETTTPVIVGPGVEVEDLGSKIIQATPVIIDIDISDTQILITAVNNQPLSFKDDLEINVLTPTAPQITGVKVNPATNWPGFTKDFTFTSAGRNIYVTLGSLTASQGAQILLDVVPEPAAGGLALCAAAGLTAIRRRRS